jgi:hypothetical protein
MPLGIIGERITIQIWCLSLMPAILDIEYRIKFIPIFDTA